GGTCGPAGARQGRAGPVRIDRISASGQLVGRRAVGRRGGAPRQGDLRAPDPAQGLREQLGVSAGDEVLWHRTGREAAVADRVQRAVRGDLALVEVRTVLVLTSTDVGRRALGPGHAERMAAGAALVEDLCSLALLRGQAGGDSLLATCD